MPMDVTMKLIKRGDMYWVHATLKLENGESVRVRKSTSVPVVMGAARAQIAAAKVIEEERARAMRSASPVFGSLGDLADLYMNRPGGVSKGTARVAKMFKVEFGHVPVSALDSTAIMAWHHRDPGRKAGTIAREMAVTIALLRYAEDFGVELPRWKVKKPSVSDARDRWLTEDERDRLLSCFTHGTAHSMATFLFYTGARLGEAMGLTWDWVRLDPESGQPVAVVLRSKKGRGARVKKRVVPLTGEAQQAMGAPMLVGRVFSNSKGGAWTGDRFRARWNKACEYARIEDFRPHDARHTFASLLVQKGVGLEVVGRLLGHSTQEMTDRYAHLTPSQFEDAVGVLSAKEGRDTEKVARPRSQYSQQIPQSEGGMVPPPRFELGTSRLPSGRSTPELRRHNADPLASDRSVEEVFSNDFNSLTKGTLYP